MFRVVSRGFTLVELMIVIAIIGILAGALYPNIMSYMSRGRDVVRISDIKDLSVKFQDYIHLNEAYPDNTNKDGITSYCVSDVMLWENALPIFPAKQYSGLGGTGALRKDIIAIHPHIGICMQDGSYFYARVMKETHYAVLAARMENQKTGANWSGALLLTDSGSLDAMIRGKQLNIEDNDPDKLFVLVTN